jgi:predicted nucleic acid-binding protein
LSPRFFFDTSALIKLYHEEDGTAMLDQLLLEHQPVIIISDLSIIEMVSAFAKKVRVHAITEETFKQVVAAFEKDVLVFEVIYLDQAVKNRAVDLLKNRSLEQGLRTLDALQLAAALSGNITTSLDMFVAADKVLVNVAKTEDLPVLLV